MIMLCTKCKGELKTTEMGMGFMRLKCSKCEQVHIQSNRPAPICMNNSDYIKMKTRVMGHFTPEPKVPLQENGCECGADKHGFASHSTWCPKYKEEK